MAKLLHQDRIIGILKGEGIAISRKQLSDFLDANPVIGRLRIRPRGRGIDPDVEGMRPHKFRWYDVLSDEFTADQADNYVAEYIKNTAPFPSS